MIILKNLSAHIQGEPLFEKLSTVVRTTDRVGIVGPNGSGKSTLMRILAGQLEPDAGSVRIEQERIGYLPQDFVFIPEETIESFIEPVPVAVREKVLKEVGLHTKKNILSMETRVSELSGGQKRRLALARVLGSGPTFLLLDEPTNHLDRDSIEWLEGFIDGFRGGVVLISHDRSMLDHTVTKILEIDSQTHGVNEYAGNYSWYLGERKRRDALQNEAHDRQQREKKRIEAWIAKKKEEAKIYDDPGKGKMIRAREKYLQREILDKEIKRAGPGKKIRGAHLEGEVARAKLICRVEAVSKSFGDKTILKDVSFEMRGKERVLLMGENGSGKTTLLKILRGELAADSGMVRIGDNMAIGYFSQEQEFLNLQKTVLEEFTDTPDLILSRDPRAVLGSFLFSDQDVFKKVSSLSLGERVRLLFAKLTHQKNELLILDEPTNHLDIQSREVIEDALQNFDGAVLAVSHDRYFVEKIGFTTQLLIEKGKIVNYALSS